MSQRIDTLQTGYKDISQCLANILQSAKYLFIETT